MSDRKGSTSGNVHPGRPKKRKFNGNRYTNQKDTEYTSASAKKLKDGMDMEVSIASSFAYCILEFASVFSAISGTVICKECKSDVSFTQSSFQGLGFKIVQSCNCEKQKVINSCPMIQNACEINRRFVFVMRLLGIGHKGVNFFCSLMDICLGIGNSTYCALLENIHIAAASVFGSVLTFAVTQENTMNEEAGKPRDELTVSGDGTWEKRGLSLFGVSTLIGKYTGKVLDAMVMSSFCAGCNNWKNKRKTEPLEYEMWFESHKDECSINHTGSCREMEISAITQMFARSMDKHGVKYRTYEDLSRDKLLTRLGAETQNNNESLNSLIWTFAPKHLHSDPKIVEIATYMSVIIFNEGFRGILKAMTIMGCPIGREAHTYVHNRDEARIALSERHRSNVEKKARIEARAEQSSFKDFQEEEEGVLYGPSIAD